MKIAALTMVYRDCWALSRWYAHHGRLIGAQNLFVVAHGADPRIAEICPEASIITVPRDRFDNFDRTRAEMLDGFHAGLSKLYDWVIRTDADELICYDPDLWSGLPEVLTSVDGPVATALGFDLVMRDEDSEMTDGTVFSQRRAIAFSGHYSKAVAARRPVSFQLHGVKVAPRKLADFPFHMPRGLYLAHLKYANRSVLSEGNTIRMQIARGPGKGLPGAGWAEAEDDARTFYEGFAAKPERPWEEAQAEAHATLSVKPARVERFSLVKTRALKLPFRTTLPDRFAEQG
ncbi:glycosyltransferase family 2 protein [Sagittula sp. S175]|uniref:glycosyltransferase family 2 protein n=1 Tax=Sagittula sp. S175 TaxID=3415129 RepID=UPI003C7EC5CB